MRYNANGIQNVLNSGEGSVDGNARLGHGIASGQPVIYSEYSLPDRTFLTGSTRNRTRIKTRFSSPGGFETLSRGHLDPAHETMSPNNAMTFNCKHTAENLVLAHIWHFPIQLLQWFQFLVMAALTA